MDSGVLNAVVGVDVSGIKVNVSVGVLVFSPIRVGVGVKVGVGWVGVIVGVSVAVITGTGDGGFLVWVAVMRKLGIGIGGIVHDINNRLTSAPIILLCNIFLYNFLRIIVKCSIFLDSFSAGRIIPDRFISYPFNDVLDHGQGLRVNALVYTFVRPMIFPGKSVATN